MTIAQTPKAPYYAVIFTAIFSKTLKGYEEMALRMVELAKEQKGFLGYESAASGLEITVSYWEDLESISTWRKNSEHQIAQKYGKTNWYDAYKIRIAKVEREYGTE